MAQGASGLDSALNALMTVENIINALPDSAFENRNNRNALLKRIDATFAQLEAGAYLGAIKTLKSDIEDKLSQWILVSQQAALIDALETTIASVICVEVDGMVIPARSIDLPTTGGLVTSTTVVRAAGTGAAAIGAYCRVLGEISPVDPTAPKIKFQVDLPASWNHKAMAFGGGGFDGSIPNVAGNVGFGPTDQKFPLGRGYATFGSDSGHQAGSLGSQDCRFALNDDVLRNFTVGLKTLRCGCLQHQCRHGRCRKRRLRWSTGGREALPPSNAGPRTGTAPSLCIRPGTIWAPCFKASAI
jgi:hypothetical protein